MLLIVVERELHVLDDSFGGEGGACDGIYVLMMVSNCWAYGNRFWLTRITAWLFLNICSVVETEDVSPGFVVIKVRYFLTHFIIFC